VILERRDRVREALRAEIAAMVIGEAHGLDAALLEDLRVLGLAAEYERRVDPARRVGERRLEVGDGEVVLREHVNDAREGVAIVVTDGVHLGVEGARRARDPVIGAERAVADRADHDGRRRRSGGGDLRASRLQERRRGRGLGERGRGGRRELGWRRSGLGIRAAQAGERERGEDTRRGEAS
jgi:hypothetical protein